MRSNTKKLFFWSSLGTIAVGAVVALARGRSRFPPQPLACRKIPRGCSGVHLWTERFEIETNGIRNSAHDRYLLKPTHFKLWSVLDLRFQGGAAAPAAGADIFHVTQIRFLTRQNQDREEEYLLDRFYGIVTVVDAVNGRSCGTNVIARGGFLEIRKCFVGGTSNGVESGEAHRSTGRVLNYRIENP